MNERLPIPGKKLPRGLQGRLGAEEDLAGQVGEDGREFWRIDCGHS